jgi:hypothetical protein
VEEPFWKRLWTCRESDRILNEWIYICICILTNIRSLYNTRVTPTLSLSLFPSFSPTNYGIYQQPGHLMSFRPLLATVWISRHTQNNVSQETAWMPSQSHCPLFSSFNLLLSNLNQTQSSTLNDICTDVSAYTADTARCSCASLMSVPILQIRQDVRAPLSLQLLCQ